MHNIDPKEMDALFKEGAEKYEFEYNDASWALMEEKLDKKERKRRWIWLFLGLMLLGFFSTVFFYTYDSDPKTEKESIALSQNEPSNKKEISLQKSIDSDISNNKEDLRDQDIISPDLSKESDIIEDSKVRPSNIGAQNSFQRKDTDIHSTQNEFGVSAENITLPTNKEKETTHSMEIAHSETKEASNIQTTIAKEEESQKSILLLSLLPYKNELLDYNRSFVVNDSPIIPFESDIDLSPKLYRFVGTIHGGYEFSGADVFKASSDGFSNGKSGYKIGAKAGVQFFDKFQLDLGIAYSLKRYGSKGEMYQLDGGWDNVVGTNPTWFDGKCSVLEIPLEASYYFNGYKNDGFYINTGLSSYFINSEWYGFKYSEEDMVDPLISPNLIDEITMDDISSPNFHFLGAGRIAFGYQKILSNKSVVEVSPYLLFPLTGIGEGKVNLYSAGLRLAMKFNTE